MSSERTLSGRWILCEEVSVEIVSHLCSLVIQVLLILQTIALLRLTILYRQDLREQVYNKMQRIFMYS